MTQGQGSAAVLVLVRHARPLIAAGTCYGQLDLPADAEKTLHCAQALAGQLPYGIQVTSSPLQRCERLALALHGLRPDLAYQTDARLQEMHFGDWEGRSWQAIAPAELQAWTERFADYAVGSTGESVAAFMARVASAFDELTRAPSPALWITHAGVMRAVQLLARGERHITQAKQWPLSAPDYGQWQTVALPFPGSDTNR